MDLSPFLRINPCGYAGLEMVDCAQLKGPETIGQASKQLVDHFCDLIGIQRKEFREGFDE